MNLQPMRDGTTIRRVVVFSGGTVVHVRPHFSLCAPAYGTVGDSLTQKLEEIDAIHNLLPPRPNFFLIENYKTKMAGGSIETNQDLSDTLDKVLEDKDVSAIIMAAAICDFEPNGLYLGSGDTDYSGSGHGKDKPRLDSRFHRQLHLKPSEKMVDKIKQKRPDIVLVTFKTTSNESIEALARKSTQNLEKCGADIVLGNDIKNHFNVLVSENGVENFDNRDECLSQLALRIITHPYKSD